MLIQKYKRCVGKNGCDYTKKVGSFSMCKANPDGRNANCKGCVSKLNKQKRLAKGPPERPSEDHRPYDYERAEMPPGWTNGLNRMKKTGLS